MNDWTSLFRQLTTDTLDTVDTVKSVNSVQSVDVSKGEEEAPISPLVASFAALERRRPDHIEDADWQHAVEDGHRFVIQWGKRATALGWVESDVFSLPPVPPNPHPSWRRLARVDQLGLVWLTHGRPVSSISSESATIATPRGGSVAFYRVRARQEAQKTIEQLAAEDAASPAAADAIEPVEQQRLKDYWIEEATVARSRRADKRRRA